MTCYNKERSTQIISLNNHHAIARILIVMIATVFVLVHFAIDNCVDVIQQNALDHLKDANANILKFAQLKRSALAQESKSSVILRFALAVVVQRFLNNRSRLQILLAFQIV